MIVRVKFRPQIYWFLTRQVIFFLQFSPYCQKRYQYLHSLCFADFYDRIILEGNSEHVARIFFSDKFQIFGCGRSRQKHLTDQNSNFTLHVLTYFWVTILFKHHEKNVSLLIILYKLTLISIQILMYVGTVCPFLIASIITKMDKTSWTSSVGRV